MVVLSLHNVPGESEDPRSSQRLPETVSVMLSGVKPQPSPDNWDCSSTPCTASEHSL